MKAKARKTSALPNRIYTYGCLPPTENADLVEEQCRRAYAYQNALIEIERARRVEIKKIELLVPVIASAHADAQLVSDRAETLFQKRLADRTNKGLILDLREARQIRAATWKTYYEVKKKEYKTNESLQERVKAVSRAAYEAAKAAYNAPEAPYWGTSLLVNMAVESAKQSVPPDSRKALQLRDPENDPCRLGVQLQGGLGIAALGMRPSQVPTDRRLQLVANGTTPGGRRQFALLRLRVGSCGPHMRDPVWAVFPVVIDRFPPADGVIKYAWVRRWRVGLQYHYALQLTIEAESFRAPVTEKKGAAYVTIALKERADGAVHVADVTTSRGNSSEIILSVAHMGALRKVSDLESIQDKLFNAMRDELGLWIDAARAGEKTREAIWAALVATDLKASTHAQLRELAFRWKSNRFSGDEMIFEKMDAWRHRSKHLYGWEANQRTKVVRQRNAMYEELAVQLARKFGEIHLIVGEEKPSFLKQFAALFRLCTLFKRAAAKYGASIIESKASAAA